MSERPSFRPDQSSSTGSSFLFVSGALLLGLAMTAPLGAMLLGGCEDSTTPDPDGGAGTGGEGGCPVQPVPLYTLTITAPSVPVPVDTTVHVVWSAGEETFVLDDPSTWKTLEDGINVVCAVDHDAGPPADLDQLICQLWTTGATEVEVTATGYIDNEQTLRPKESELCDAIVPTDVTVVLQPMPDGGS